MTQYRMDGWMFQHMGEWALNYGPFAREDAEGEVNLMVAYLESLHVEDAEYLVSQGLTRVYDAANMDAIARGLR